MMITVLPFCEGLRTSKALPDFWAESGSAVCVSTIIASLCFAVAVAKEHTDP